MNRSCANEIAKVKTVPYSMDSFQIRVSILVCARSNGQGNREDTMVKYKMKKAFEESYRL